MLAIAAAALAPSMLAGAGAHATQAMVAAATTSASAGAPFIVRSRADVLHDAAVALFGFAGSYAWLKMWDVLATAERIPSSLSRKMVHTTSVPIFMLTWPLFRDSAPVLLMLFAGGIGGGGENGGALTASSTWLHIVQYLARSPQGIAAAVPAILSLRLVVAGLGYTTDTLVNALARQKAALQKLQHQIVAGGNGDGRSERDDAVAARENDHASNNARVSGDRREALRGPLYYCVATTFCTLLFWRGPSPVGVLALVQMCIGDGIADIVGRRWNTPHWPAVLGARANAKTVGGTLAYVGSAFVASLLYIYVFSVCGCVNVDVTHSVGRIAALTLVCAAVELVVPGDDNITVPLAACILGSYLFAAT